MARLGPIRFSRSARLTPRGGALAVVGVASVIGAYAGGRPELLYLGCLTLLLPAFAVAFARFRRVGLTVSRSFRPEPVGVGQPAVVDLTIAGGGQKPTPQVEWRDNRPWASGGTESRVLPALASRGSRGATVRLRYELIPPHRGEFPIGPLGVRLADPFGLAKGEVAVGTVDWLVVAPVICELPDTGLAIFASEGASLLVRRSIGGEDDLSTREYRTGDAMRRVHWRATARHGELMVRQEEPRSHAKARIILDTRSTGYADHQPGRRTDEPQSESFELAVSIAASIALHLARGGFAVEFVETGERHLAPVSPTEPFLRSLATLELAGATGEYPVGSTLASTRPDRIHGSVFAIVSDADAPTIERLVAQRSDFDLAVAFVVTWRDSLALETLRRAGWTCVPVALGDSVEDAWRAVADLQGVRRGP
ncbi:MAG: DUF58 domain-containing protein [Microbacteriaceae bacterium]|nr:DUF58 domain-containing protein [Microbacteriaceae bacterium]